jgi:hypothetical protein
MTPSWRVDLDELEADGDLGEGRSSGPPERANRNNLSRRVQKRARRTRSNDTAKRGMHRRRNKRIAW